MIYFLQSPDGGPVKIGFTGNLDARRRQLETHYRQPLALLATQEGNLEAEREIHTRFSHLRLGRTEQFRPTAELMEFIGLPLFVGMNPETVEAMTGQPVIRPTALTLKGSLEWRAWVERGAEHCRTDVAKLVDAALVQYLRGQGFAEPAPKR